MDGSGCCSPCGILIRVCCAVSHRSVSGQFVNARYALAFVPYVAGCAWFCFWTCGVCTVAGDYCWPDDAPDRTCALGLRIDQFLFQPCGDFAR